MVPSQPSWKSMVRTKTRREKKLEQRIRHRHGLKKANSRLWLESPAHVFPPGRTKRGTSWFTDWVPSIACGNENLDIRRCYRKNIPTAVKASAIPTPEANDCRQENCAKERTHVGFAHRKPYRSPRRTFHFLADVKTSTYEVEIRCGPCKKKQPRTHEK